MHDPKIVIMDTFEYVKQMLIMGIEPAYSISDYNNFKVFESDLQGKTGVKHEPDSEDGSPVWLEIERLEKKPSPDPSTKLEPWLKKSDNPNKEPSLYEWIVATVTAEETDDLLINGYAKKENVLKSPKLEGMFDVRLFSEDDAELKAVFLDYLKNKWMPWSEYEKPRREVIAIYNKLFDIYQVMATGDVEKPIELVWGIGFALWDIPDSPKSIRHPMIEVLVEVELDSITQSLKIGPRSVTNDRAQLYTAPYEMMELPGVKPLKDFFINQLDLMEAKELSIHPFDPETFSLILRTAVSLLASDAKYYPDLAGDVTNRKLPRARGALIITDTWAIYARSRGVNTLVRDIERFQDKIKQDDSIKNKMIIKIAKEPSDERPQGRMINTPDSENNSGFPDSENDTNDFYFPKPYNDKQLEIVKRLEKSEGVVVQGPPGTGKTHTIANIICHYLATGRRVLVTAKSETALEVLKQHIPKDIQPLVISMVSNDREGLRQQKEAVETLQVKVVGLQGKEEQIYRQIATGEDEVFKLKKDVTEINDQIKKYAATQFEEIKNNFEGKFFKNAGDLALWVINNRKSFDWFPDSLGHEDDFEPKFTDDDIKAIISARELVGNDIGYVKYNIPNVNNLFSIDMIERIHTDLVKAEKIETTTIEVGMPRFNDASLKNIQIAESLLKEIRIIREWFDSLDDKWFIDVFMSMIYPDNKEKEWMKVIKEMYPEFKNMVEERKKYLRNPIAFDAKGEKELHILKAAASRGKTGKNPLTLVQMLDKQAKSIINSVTITGKSSLSPKGWAYIENYLNYKEKCYELSIRWNALADEGPVPEIKSDQIEKRIEKIWELFSDAEEIAQKMTKIVWPGIDMIFPANHLFKNFDPNAEQLDSIIKCIEKNLALCTLSASLEQKNEAIKYLGNYDCPEAKNLLEILVHKVGSAKYNIDDIKKEWHSEILRLQQLRGLKSHFETIRMVSNIIKNSGAINWSDYLSREIFNEKDKELIYNWKDAWQWSQLHSLLNSLDVQEHLTSLEKERIEKEKRIDQLFEDVVKLRTYLMLCQNMTEKAKSNLAIFMAATMNIGKGKGIKAPIFMFAAQKAMMQCAKAIPCWIMPSWRVSEVLPAEFDLFDLIIVDEASQCDIRDLPAIARGKKLLVVGDDRQVSPTAPFIEFKKFVQLKHNFLRDQPFADLMLPGYSLYDLAGAVFPGSKTLLDEHFRCVEAIIRFSFQFYAEKIHPLRIPKANERIEPPLVDILVENGFKKGDLNLDEAEIIVNEIEKLVTDKRYENRSIGVISLIGRKQAALIQKWLLDRIGQNTFMKHQIICGDSATFQGREKDIIFLSMVASTDNAKSQTVRSAEQRYNVAASRARDRLYLVRSVSLEKLKQDDLKAKLIRHFQEPMPYREEIDEELKELCESDFEKEVFTELSVRGYFVIPQVHVGEYRIDLVVEGDNDRRLAIELDGDRHHGSEKWLEDWTRQKILERVGWKFWRCWASSYYKDPEGCLDELFGVFNEMGIKPREDKAKKYAFTQSIVVKKDIEKPENEEPEDLAAETSVAVGDQVVIVLTEKSNAHYTVNITENHTEEENLIFSKTHPTGKTFIGANNEDEINVTILGKQQLVTIVQIAKGKAVSKVIEPEWRLF